MGVCAGERIRKEKGMPKLKKFKPIEQETRELELRKLYGGKMTIADICIELGNVSRKTAERWVSGTPAIKVNGKRRFAVADIAALEYAGRMDG